MNQTKHYFIVIAIFLFLFSSVTTFAQPSRKTTLAANQGWQGFWHRFTTAINKKDRQALKTMMPDDFYDGGGDLTPDEWLKYIDDNERNGSWRDLRRSFARGTVFHKAWSAKGIPTRVTKDNGYYFEFRKDKKWCFAGVVGD